MPVTVRLAAASLPYEGAFRLHTATSGRVDALHELYLFVERGDGLTGIGEVRANATYANGLPEESVPGLIRELVEALDWSDAPTGALAALPETAAVTPPLARAAVESALVEMAAREADRCVAEVLGGRFEPSLPSNQCLFWSDDDGAFLAQAEGFISEGFRDLKMRVGVAGHDRDLARLAMLRERFGDAVRLSVDANGSWTAAQALDFLDRAAPYRLDYVEQPTTIGDWDAFVRVGREGAVPPMLDEGLKTVADVARLVSLGPPFLAHLKVSKMGGPMAVVASARALAEAGVGFMVGQMNEGALATALTVHCAMAAQPLHRELYGCYGLSRDPARGVSYRDGRACVPSGPGLGIGVDRRALEPLWEIVR
ncbi:MAG TPA: mandelate racemase/muconate lactonizing enzyme family protein [Gammaproteobacteria bacterium]|nr:mandelate racemase/muconate lactonizing enzyme family protein [Gammaproteobacteria bacterium]